MIQNFLKFRNKDEIEYNLEILEQAIQYASDDISLISEDINIIPSEIELFNAVSRISKNPIYSIVELNFICLVIEVTTKIHKKKDSWKIFNHFINFRPQLDIVNKEFCRDFRRFVSQDAQIDYLKHRELGPLFTKLNSIEKSLREKIVQISKRDEFKNVIQFGGFDIIFDRYVLPVRSDGYNNELGPIVAKSNSGMTLYIEPYEVRNMATLRVKIMAEIEAKIQKICNDYSHFLHQHANLVEYFLNLITEIDIVNSKAKYSLSNDLTRPKISLSEEIIIEDFYHPLIKDPVKNSFTLSAGLNGIIISGPNTGGKTVVLKSVAIIHLFLHFGLFVPAKLAIIPHFDSIFYMGSDNQDLMQGLSSFSSEVENYFNLFKNIGKRGLIIIDEIFNSTSSEEASALALAVLEEFVSLSQKNISLKIFASTHHNLLKSYLNESKRFLSGHMGFDSSFKRPTYQLYLGAPGSSMALEIFESLVDNNYLELKHISLRSKEILGEKYLTYERQLSEISHKNLELDKLVRENKQLNIELKNQKSSAEGLLFLEKKNAYETYKNKLNEIYNQAETIIHDIKNNKIDSRSKLSRDISKINSQMIAVQEIPQTKYEIEGYYDVDTSNLCVGEYYYSTVLKTDVIFISCNKKNEAIVSVGKINFKCPSDSLKIHRNKLKKTKKIHTSISPVIDWETQDKTDYDCRGMRLDDFKNIVEISLMELLAGKIPYLKYIHGHGEGILKKWLREFLKKEKDFTWESNSNDGATVVIMR